MFTGTQPRSASLSFVALRVHAASALNRSARSSLHRCRARKECAHGATLKERKTCEPSAWFFTGRAKGPGGGLGSHRERSARFAQRLTSHPLPPSPKNAKMECFHATRVHAFATCLQQESRNTQWKCVHAFAMCSLCPCPLLRLCPRQLPSRRRGIFTRSFQRAGPSYTLCPRRRLPMGGRRAPCGAFGACGVAIDGSTPYRRFRGDTGSSGAVRRL